MPPSLLNDNTHSMILKGNDPSFLLREAGRIAASLNCLEQQPEKRPCRLCENCRRIDEGQFPGYIVIAPVGAANFIRIGQIRALLSDLIHKVGEGQTRVAVFVEADRMNEESQNCLLKTLEEPPENTLLLLLTGRPQDLLPTVRSRCRTLEFSNENLIPAQVELDLALEVFKAIRTDGYCGLFEKAALVNGCRKKRLPAFFAALEYVLRCGLIDCLCGSAGDADAKKLIEGLEHVWQAGYLLERNLNALLLLEHLFLQLKKTDIRVI